jgi:hypothetical protein
MSTSSQSIPSIPKAHAWLIEHGYEITERTVRNHVESGMLPARRSRNGKVTAIRLIDLERYARNYLEKVEDDEGATRAEFLREQIIEKRMKNQERAGMTMHLGEVKQRSTKLFSGLRRHTETAVPERVQRNTASFLAVVDSVVTDEDLRARIHSAVSARQPELIERDMEFLADMFDQFKGA